MYDVELKKTNTMLLAVLLFFGLLFLVAIPGKVHASEAPNIGVVDYGYLINQHPDTQKANATLKVEREQANKDFAAQSATLGDKEKQDLRLQLTQKVEQKRQELLKGIADKVNAAINEVAAAKQLALVITRDSAPYGGVDITAEVMKKFQ
jgi:outer membrane protein